MFKTHAKDDKTALFVNVLEHKKMNDHIMIRREKIFAKNIFQLISTTFNFLLISLLSQHIIDITMFIPNMTSERVRLFRNVTCSIYLFSLFA